MNIAYLVNKHSTYAWRALAKGFAAAGIGARWISPSRRWTKMLLADGVAARDILSLPDLQPRWEAMAEDEARRILLRWERPGAPKIADIVLMDRNLRLLPKRVATAYLAVAAEAIDGFMRDQAVDHLLGESTWAWEIIAHQVCYAQDKIPLWPQTLRLPGDRWGLFLPTSHRLWGDAPASAEDRAWAEDFLASFRARPVPPNYFGMGVSALKFRGHWKEELKRALFARDEAKGDLTLPRLSDRILGRVKMAVNSLRLRRSTLFSPDPGDGRRFILYALHHQPEASIDVIGSMHSDQAALIERLARLLPADVELWVKEHPDAIGDRSYEWFARIAALPGVRVIEPRLSTLDLLRRADLVVGVAGTVVYEATLLGAPTAITAPLYFSAIADAGPSHPDGGIVDPLSWPWERLLSGDLSRRAADPEVAAARRARAVDFLAHLRANSWPGRFDNLLRSATSGVPDPEAVDAVVAGCLDCFRRMGTWS